MHTFIRHCSSPLFHDIGLFVEQLQQAVSDQEKKILEQQALLRKQRQAAADAAAQEGGDVSMTKGPDGGEVSVVDGRISRKHKASGEDLNDSPAQRARSSSTDSFAHRTSSSGLRTLPESAPEAARAVETDKQLSAELSRPESAPVEPVAQAAQTARPRQDEFARLDESIQLTLAQMTDKAGAAEPMAVADSSKQASGDHVDSPADQKPAEPDLAATPADCTPMEACTKPAESSAVATAAGGGGAGDAPEGIKDVGDGVEHPLGGPKLDKPKRRKKYVRDSVKVCDFPSSCVCL